MKKLLILLLPFILTGCWNYQEINQLAIVTGVALDKVDNKYQLTLLIANPQKSSSDSKTSDSKIVAYSSEAETLIEAIKFIDLKSPKEMYLGHIRLFVISEGIAKEGILSNTDFLMRQPESRKNFSFILTKDSSAGDILKILTPLETFPSENISANIESSSKLQGAVTEVPYSKFLSLVYEPGINPLLSGVSIKGDKEQGSNEDALKEAEPKTQLVLEPLAIFKDDKFVAWTKREESQAINILQNNVSETVIKIPCNEKYNAYIIDNVKSKIEYKHNLDFSVNVNADVKIAELNCDVDITDSKVVENLEKEVKDKLESIINNTIEITKKEYGIDVIGFGNNMYKKSPKDFKKYQDNWDSFYLDTNIDVKVNTKIVSRGSTEETLKELQR